jgi:sec-independent protein translocase protein TatA
VILLLFGADKIPDIARTLGKGMKEFRKVTGEIKKEFESGTSDFKSDIDDLKKGIDDTKDDLTGGMRSYIKDSGIEEDVSKIKDNLKG